MLPARRCHHVHRRPAAPDELKQQEESQGGHEPQLDEAAKAPVMELHGDVHHENEHMSPGNLSKIIVHL